MPILIGIGGGSGAGKTVLAQEIQRQISPSYCVILPLESYYRNWDDLPEFNGWKNFDHPDAFDQDTLIYHLRALSMNATIQQPVYENHRRIGYQTFSPAYLTCVVGLHILNLAEFRAVLNLNIYVNTPDPIRYKRRLQRARQEWGLSTEQARLQYEQMVYPMYKQWVEPSQKYADVIVSGITPVAETARHILKRLQKCDAKIPHLQIKHNIGGKSYPENIN